MSQRGVVFFRDQDITAKQQEQLATRLGELSGKPATSKLHIHPLTAEFSEFGDFISVIDANFNQIRDVENDTGYDYDDKSLLASNGWHSEYHISLRQATLTSQHYLRKNTQRLCHFENSYTSQDRWGYSLGVGV